MTTTIKPQRRLYRGISYAVAGGRDDRAGWYFYLHGDDGCVFGDYNTAKEAHDSAKSMIDGHLEDDRS